MRQARSWAVVALVVTGTGGAFAACTTGNSNGPGANPDGGALGDGALPGLDGEAPDTTTTADASDATTPDAAVPPDTGAGDTTQPTDALPDSPTDAGADASSDAGPDAATDAADAGAPLVAIATGLGQMLTSVFVSGANVFWVDQSNSTIEKCAIGGCGSTPTTLYKDPSIPNYLTADGTKVYFTDATLDVGAVQSVPIDSDGGIAPTVLAPAQPDLLGIAIDATGLYWANDTYSGSLNNGAVSRCDPANCAATLSVTSGQTSARNVALGATSVYWAGNGNPGSTGYVRSAPKGGFDGGFVSLVSNAQNAMLVTLDSTNFYFAALTGSGFRGQVSFCPLGGCDGGPALLSTSAVSTSAGNTIVSDGTNVYFVGSGHAQIFVCPTAGCTGAATTYATLPSGVYASSIAADATSLYVTATNTVYRIAK